MKRKHGQNRGRREGGFTLLEMIVVLGILAVLAVAVIPIARNDVKRRKEKQLKYALEDLRRAIDSYKADCERGMVGPLDHKINDECFPPTLDILVEGINPPNSTRTIKYLREIPIDPMTGSTEWGMRSIQDEPGSESWGGENVWDVYSKSEDTALNGTKYKEW